MLVDQIDSAFERLTRKLRFDLLDNQCSNDIAAHPGLVGLVAFGKHISLELALRLTNGQYRHGSAMR